MPLRLDIKRKLTARSDRVKSCDLHPTEQWMLVSLYNGNVHIWNHESQQLVKSFEVCELPVRAAIFVPRKNWVVTGSDDMQVRPGATSSEITVKVLINRFRFVWANIYGFVLLQPQVLMLKFTM